MSIKRTHQANRFKDSEAKHLKSRLLAARKVEHELRTELERTHNSLSWRLTTPLRKGNSFIQKKGIPVRALRFAISQFRTSVAMFGIWKTFAKSFRFLSEGKFTTLARSSSQSRPSNQKLFAAPETSRSLPLATSLMKPKVLLIAELSIPQCKKYRVDQKAELLTKCGVGATIVNWTDFEEVRTQLQLHPIAIFYRVPAFESVIQLIEEANRLKVQTFWEVDDLIFDIDAYLANRNLDSLDKALRESVLAGVPLYKKALMLCDAGISSTQTLADVMKATTGKPSYVVENALDGKTIAIAQRIHNSTLAAKNHSKEKGAVTIVYGSGSKAHNSDFLEASAAIINVLKNRPHVRLRIVGELEIGSQFAAFSQQIERMPFTNFEEYLQNLANSDISIAPLENTVFNDAKSNIKYLEASVIGLPSVCSPRDAFQSAITDGDNGFLACTTQEWERKLLALVDDRLFRESIGANAKNYVLANYRPENIAVRQVKPLLQTHENRLETKLKILIANVYFSPQSFGGATIVAEEMAQRLAKRPDVEVYVFTSWIAEDAPDYSVLRYSTKGATVIGVKLPPIRTKYMDIDDHAVAEIFDQVLDLIEPDVVHLHSVQMLGVGLADACREKDIPYAITLHDAWWLCERQFMITGENKYCYQTKIDPAVCAACVSDSQFNLYRADIMRWELEQAPSLIAPSQFFKHLHVQNGIDAHKILVNKNGVRPPAIGYSKRTSSTLRFGYVGGISSIKGFDLILEAFSELPECDVELVLVDNTVNLGYSSFNIDDIKITNSVKVVAGYTQDTIDDFFSGIDVLLFPTQWKESFGLTVREALIRDIWVIASDAGGVIEDIVPGENGIIIPISRSSEPLKSAIMQCINQRQMLRDFVNPHRTDIHTFNAQADELYRHLKSLADTQTGEPYGVAS